ncbi:glutathione hydrolase 1 proenzyme-like [Porites lutea]|uniref:glutathione hydrolase 1 proenzyme-like n=1 Tax=Porites lutea TaxID=51062 RepID=UPI003CC6AF86
MHSSGVGGGGVMLVYSRKLKNAKVIDFRETAPAATTSDMFTGEDMSKRGRFEIYNIWLYLEDNEGLRGELFVPFPSITFRAGAITFFFFLDRFAIAIPGEVHGQYRAWREYGRLPWKDLVQPAIDLASKGFPISTAVADALSEDMVEKIKEDNGLRELLLDKNDKPLKEGTIIKNEQYAMTQEKIRDNPESFYNGPLAKSISQDITELIPDEPKKGQVTEEDLRNYQTEIREPLESELAGMKMHLTPPPTSGAVLGLILNILKGYNMTSSARDGTDASVLTYHRIIEAFKFGYAWRSRLGDPAFNMDKKINEIAQNMIEQQLGDKLRKLIQDDQTQDNVSYYARLYSDADYGTTHLAVLAKNGDAVSVTSTVNHRFRCKFRSNLTGIIYNNQMADFDNPNDTEINGVYPSVVNFPDPGKRPFASMSAAILTDNKGDVQLVIGASGGKRITTAVSLVLMNMLWFGKDISQAVDDPRIHEELVPKMDVEVENNKDYRLPEDIQDGLRALGHNVTVAKETAFAVVQAVYRKPGEGIYAKSDPRKFGAPAGG